MDQAPKRGTNPDDENGAPGDGWEAFDLIPDPVLLICIGVVEFANQAALDILAGGDAEAILGHPVKEFFHEDYAEIEHADLLHLAEMDEALPVKFVTRESDEVDLEIRLCAAPNDDTAVFMHAREVTEKIRAAEHLLRSEYRHRALVERSLSMICTCRDEVITYLNPAGAEMLGYDLPEALIGRPIADIAHGTWKGVFEMGLETFIGEHMPFPVLLSNAKGESVDAEISIVRMGYAKENTFMVEVHDITEHNRTVTALRHLNERLEERVLERTQELRAEIAERIAAQEKLEVAATVYQNSADGILVTDPDFLITDVNPAFTEITGYPPEEILGQKPFMLTTSREAVEYEAVVEEPLREDGHWEAEIWSRNADGEEYALRIVFNVVKGSSERVIHYACLINDITKRKRDEEQMRFQANYDSLTGLPNRTMFNAALSEAVEWSARHDRGFALMFIDLDGFKAVNDTLGHDVGDRLLQEAGARLQACARSNDLVARLGGDEFTVILRSVSSEHDIELVACRILDSLDRSFVLGENEAKVSGSIGIARFPQDGEDEETLLNAADGAMYRAKRGGKANFVFHGAE